jgi:hypothetical protein
MDALSRLEDEAEILKEKKASGLAELGSSRRKLEKEQCGQQRTEDMDRNSLW